MTHRIVVKHNMEVAHRLMNLPGKCQQIHGHSMQVYLTLEGDLDEWGILEGQDFSNIKKSFRAYIDSIFDHHLHLNREDPWAQPVFMLVTTVDQLDADKPDVEFDPEQKQQWLPGLMVWPGDPTVENLAKWIGEHASLKTSYGEFVTKVTIWETNTNSAEWVRDAESL